MMLVMVVVLNPVPAGDAVDGGGSNPIPVGDAGDGGGSNPSLLVMVVAPTGPCW